MFLLLFFYFIDPKNTNSDRQATILFDVKKEEKNQLSLVYWTEKKAYNKKENLTKGKIVKKKEKPGKENFFE